MTRFSRAVLLAGLGLSIAFLGYHHLALTDLIFGKGDAYHYFTPLWAARDAALRAGQLPLWTDRLFMGAPLLADSQLGTFYPPNWLTVGLPAWQALKVSVFLHVGLAATGAYVLARRSLGAGFPAAVIGAAVFALGGYVGAHAEQINQLQGIAWMPWAFACLTDRRGGLRGALMTLFPLALVLALIALSGHTQTLFITGVGLGIYALAAPPRETMRRTVLHHARLLAVIAGAALLAMVLAAVQIIPTLELTGLSNRGGGFSAQAAMAFSWQPNLAARGLLPSLDGQVFGEYVAYLGVIGLALALWGTLHGGARRWPWLALLAVGVIFAFGLYNPLYWLLAELPGFNLFRVPARWLGLFALGGAMLAALGVESLMHRPVDRAWRSLALVIGTLAALMLLAVWRSPAAAVEVDGSAAPTPVTLLFWLAGVVLFVNVTLLRGALPRRVLSGLLVIFVLGELGIAATNMPHRDLVDPMAATDPRQSVRHIAAAGEGRVLSVSPAYFDTYDHAALLERYAALGMTERGSKAGLTAAKLRELLAPNFPLLYGVASVDGFGGGILPTVYYSAFTSLLLPDGAPRTLDGRLRELLASPDCIGACLPESRWLDLMGVTYLLRDKTYDRFYDDIQFDLGLSFSAADATPIDAGGHIADEIHILAAGEALTLRVDGRRLAASEARPVEDGLVLMRFALAAPAPVKTLRFGGDARVYAASLVDSRTGAFTMLPSGGWRKILSSDIKLYQAITPPPVAVSARHVVHAEDNWNGSEDALRRMRAADFDPATTVILHGAPESLTGSEATADVRIKSRTAESITYAVEVAGDGPLVLLFPDAYFPGWTATIDGQHVPLYRADVMFRAVAVPSGTHTLTIAYHPPWLAPLLAFGGAVWVIFGLVWLAARRT